MDLASLRHEYASHGLDVEDLDPDPLAQFRRWYDEADAAGVWEPNAMVVATVGTDGTPDARYVLLRGLDAEHGFQFYTSYHSAKARQLTAHPSAALTFGWLDLHRQVRVTGPVGRLPEERSDAYFASRPRSSRIGAWASPQSEVLADRSCLERRVAQIEERFGAGDVPRPPGWGGYAVAPKAVEFWQGRPSRLHDRLRYRHDHAGGWVVERLAP